MGEEGSQETHLLDLPLIKEQLCHLVGDHPGLNQGCRYAKSPRSGVSVMKGPGIRQDCHVKIGGNLRGEGYLHHLNQVIDHLASGCGCRIHPVICSKVCVGDVVVDIDHQASGWKSAEQPPDSSGIRGIQDEVTVKGMRQPIRANHLSRSRQGAKVLRNRVWVKGNNALSQGLQGEMTAQGGAQGIPLRIDVGENGQRVDLLQGHRDLVKITVHPAYGHPLSPTT